MSFLVSAEEAATCCGVLEIGRFYEELGEPIDSVRDSPTGLIVSYFVEGNSTSTHAFEEMAARWPILFRSPVRKSTSQWASKLAKERGIYMVVFDQQGAHK